MVQNKELKDQEKEIENEKNEKEEKNKNAKKEWIGNLVPEIVTTLHISPWPKF